MRRTDRRFKRGAYLLPTLFTVGNLFCGYTSLVATIRGRFELAATMVFIAAALDLLDGRVARMTGTSSEFGREFDSLSDALSFAVAPALLVQQWGLPPLGRVGWLASFLFVACGVVRLARFNIQSGGLDKRFFIGLPIPAAAMALASCVEVSPAGPPARWLEGAVLALLCVLSVLMVSRLRFRSFKDLDLKGRLPSVAVVAVALAFVAVALDPPNVMLALSLAYVISGLLPRRLVQRWADRPAGTGLRVARVDDGERRR
jgi:CDP-diacylglycerol--serine O-phosphatidyltransferase